MLLASREQHMTGDTDDEWTATDAIDDVPLMAAIGRVAVRSNELGDALMLAIRFLTGGNAAVDGQNGAEAGLRGKTLGARSSSW
jgi:hypothetical protein